MREPTNSSLSPAHEPSLLPREHGAWGQLAMPLASGLALGKPGSAAFLIAAGVVLAFLAHEPLLVVLGQRGQRPRRELGARALRRLLLLGCGAAASGLAGLALAPTAARIAALAPAALVLLMSPLVVRRREHTAAGELVAAAALSAAAVPVALASRVPAAWAWGVAFTWLASFSAAMLPVHATLLWARTKGERELRPLAAAGSFTIGVAAIAFAAFGPLPRIAAAGVLPTSAVATFAALARFRPQRFTYVGWSFMGASITTLLVLVIGFRS